MEDTNELLHEEEKEGIYVDAEDMQSVTQVIRALCESIHDLNERVYYLDNAFRTHGHDKSGEVVLPYEVVRNHIEKGVNKFQSKPSEFDERNWAYEEAIRLLDKFSLKTNEYGNEIVVKEAAPGINGLAYMAKKYTKGAATRTLK